MILLFFLLWPVLEIYLFIKVTQTFGFFDAFMATLTAFFLGLLIVKALGRTFLVRVQAELQQGRVPANTLINSALIFIGGMFIMIPGFFSDVMGLILILPGARHAFALYVRFYLSRKISAGTFKVFNSRFGAGFGTGPRKGGFPGFGGDSQAHSATRDVSPKIIDVKPISSSEERE